MRWSWSTRARATRTIEIARSFGARGHRARVDGLLRATPATCRSTPRAGDWLMYLDADEVLVREDAERLRALTGRTWREAFYLAETNHTGELEDGTAVTHSALRVFRNRPEYRFEGRLHEQIAAPSARLPAGAHASRASCASSTSATWGRCATAGQKSAAQHRAAAPAAGREPAERIPALQPRLRARRRRRARGAPSSSSSGRGRC